MTEPSVPAASRRAVLSCAGAACVAALAGCETYNSNNGGIAGSSSPAAPASPESGRAAPGGSHVLARTTDVPVGGGKILSAQKIVITQPKAGRFNAFTAVCTHQGCIVGSVASGTINCLCHGSKFSIANGSVVNGPATSPLAPVRIKVRGTSIIQA